jgi:hypothetical protein
VISPAMRAAERARREFEPVSKCADALDGEVTGECKVAMSGPTCMNPKCPPCQTPETEPFPTTQGGDGNE